MPTAMDLLRPYLMSSESEGRPLDDTFGRWFVDAPPAVVAAALELFGQPWLDMRGNGQPPNSWLVRQAARREGRLCGVVVEAGRRFLRVDGTNVPAVQAADLVAAVRTDWPDPWPSEGDWRQTPSELATATVWSGWDAEAFSWQGLVADYLDQNPPGEVFGLWWD